jgi:hypothetical protein
MYAPVLGGYLIFEITVASVFLSFIYDGIGFGQGSFFLEELLGYRLFKHALGRYYEPGAKVWSLVTCEVATCSCLNKYLSKVTAMDLVSSKITSGGWYGVEWGIGY